LDSHGLLRGPVDESFQENRLDDLRKTAANLQQRIDDLELELAKQKNDAKRAQLALTNLQNILGPLHRAMRAIFGEIDAAVPDFGFPGQNGPTPSPHGPQDAKWQPWIQKWSGTKKAVVIQTLLEHGPLTRTQLRSATESGWSTIDAITAQLQNLGLITKENEKWTLKNS
jgi:uncharacterized coiled-coil protein SlyX